MSNGVIFCILVSWGTQRCPGVFSGLAIHTEIKPFSVYIEIKYFMYNSQLFQNQNQNSLLVKRQNDNTSPGDWPRKISP